MDPEEKELAENLGPVDVLLDEVLHSSIATLGVPPENLHHKHRVEDNHTDRNNLVDKLLENKHLSIEQIENRLLSSSTAGCGTKLEPGLVIADRYRVDEFLSEGACGNVYKGFHLQLHVDIVIKILKQSSHPRIRARFIREAQIMATIRHPNVVRVYDVGEFNDQIYLIMEFIEGENLEHAMNRYKDRSVDDLVKLMNQISEGLSAIHGHGIIHRDIKPGNIVLNQRGNPILMDFGIAKEEENTPMKQSNLTTVVGAFLGTPHYMAPEQFKSPKNVTKASDVYALGVTFYQMLTNTLPFSGRTVFEVYCSHKSKNPSPPYHLHKKVPQRISNIVMNMLEKDPAKRFPDATTVRAELQKAQGASSAVVLSIAATLLVGVIIAFLAMRMKLTAKHEAEQVRQQSADSLLIEGRGLGLARQWDEAKSRFKEAEILYQELGKPVFAIELALWEAYRNSPEIINKSFRHTSAPLCVAISKDERMGLSGCANGSLALWNLTTGVRLNTFNESADNIPKTCVSLSSDARYALTGNFNGEISLWDVETGKKHRSFDEQNSWIRSVIFSPDDRFALSGTDDGTLLLWDVESGEIARDFSGHTNSIRSLNYSADGKLIVSGSTDGSLIIWNAVSGEFIHKFLDSKGEVLTVTLSPDSRLAISGNGNGVVKLWDVKNGQMVNSVMVHNSPVITSKFTQRGELVLFAQQDSIVTQWDVDGDRPISSFTGHLGAIVNLSISHSGELLIAATEERELSLSPTTKQREVINFSGHRTAVSTVAFSNDELIVASGSSDGQIIVWDIATALPITLLEGHRGVVTYVALTNGNMNVLSASLDGSVKLWNLAAGQEVYTFSSDSASPIETAQLSPDGQALVTGHHSGDVIIWEPETGKKIHSKKVSDKPITVVAFSHDSQRILSGNREEGLTIWTVESANVIRVLETDDLAVAGFLPKTDKVLSGHSGGELRVWNIDKGKEARRFGPESGRTTAVGIHPDGAYAISGDQMSTVRIWDIQRGEAITTLREHTDSITDVAFSPSGKKVLSGSKDKTLKLWDFSRAQHYPRYISLLPEAQKMLLTQPHDPKALKFLGEWYYFRGLWAWAVEMFSKAKRSGIDTSPLMVARCYWHTSRYELAKAEFGKALEKGEAPDYYLKLCINALEGSQERSN